MTNRRRNDAIVGVTVVLVTVLLVAVVLWVNRTDIGSRRGDVYARTRDVGGVGLGNPVVIRGVRSGRVDQIALGDSGWVVVRLSLEPDVELPADPVVLLTSASLFGEWQVTITSEAGLPADRVLRAAVAEARGAGDTLPGALLPDIAQLTAVAGRIAGDVAEVANRVRSAFDDSAALELRQTIRAFASMSQELQRTIALQSRNLDTVGVNVRRGVRDLSAAAAAIDSVARRVDASTSRGELGIIVATVQRAADELLAAATRLRVLSGDVGETQARLDRTLASADTLFGRLNRGEGSLGLLINDPSLHAESDSLLRELRALVADMRRDPRRYFNLRLF